MGRVLQFSDVHFGREHRHACAAALDFAHATPADLVLITGDVTQKGLPDEFEAAGALRILACHHPLIEMIGTPMTGDVKRGDAAAMIFAEAGVDLIATGHVHVPFALPIQLGDHCSYAVGCGTLSHRERGAPPSFNQIDWDADEIVVTAVTWTGNRFEPRQKWRLPRRQDTRKRATAPDPNVPGKREQAAN